MPVWTITGEVDKALNVTSRTLAQLGISEATLTFRTLAPDTLTWKAETSDAAGTGTILPEIGQIVQLWLDGVRKFRGHCMKVKGGFNSVTVEIVGPWYFLAEIPLTDSATDATGASDERTQFVFPAGQISDQLAALIDRAIAKGVQIDRGTIADCYNAPKVTLSEMSFATALAKLLSRVPDSVAYFDYAERTPVLNIARRNGSDAMTPLAFDIGTDGITFDGEGLNPRTDLKVSWQAIKGLKRHAVTHKPYFVSTDTGGARTAGEWVIHTLSGAEIAQQIPMEDFAEVDVSSVLWSAIPNATVKALDSALAACVENYGRAPGAVDSQVISWIGDSNNRDKRISSYPGISRKSVTGQGFGTRKYFITSTAPLPEWARLQLGAREVTINGTWVAEWRDSEKGAGTPWSAAYIALRAGAQVGGTAFEGQTGPATMEWLARPFEVTGYLISTPYAVPTTIYKDPTWDFPAIPAGMAGGLKTAQNWIPYEGTFTVASAALDGNNRLGRSINVTGGLPAWANMKATLQSVSYDLKNKLTTYALGAPARTDIRSAVGRVATSAQDNFVEI